MTFDGVSPTQQYLIDNAVMYGGYTPEEAFAEIVGTTPTASIESIGTTYSGGPTQTTFPTNVYMNPEVVVNSGDTRQPTIHATSPTYDVTKDITTVEPTETGGGIFGDAGKVGGVLDTLFAFHPVIGGPYSLFRNAQALFDEELRDGTSVGWVLNQMESPNSWWGGLVGEPTGQGLFGQESGAAGSDSPWDEGSYTDMGSYSYGTIDGIGVEDPN